MKSTLLLFSVLLLGPMAWAQGFVPEVPDTVMLNQKSSEYNPYYESMAYIYLVEYYKADGERDSVIYGDYEGDPICSYYQAFEGGISYSLSGCGEEGGADEDMVFPKMKLSDAKALIERLFYDPWNTWVSENAYEPDGAGCYYGITQTETQTIIEIYCGC
ncbi:MAG: hypothetical protein SchgKO_10670 [Schleiferiaceae bacterium]